MNGGITQNNDNMNYLDFFGDRRKLYNLANPITFEFKDNTSTFILDRLSNLRTSKSRVLVELHSDLGLELRTHDLTFAGNTGFNGSSNKKVKVYAPYNDLSLFNESIQFLDQPVTGVLDPKILTMANLRMLSFFNSDLRGGIPSNIGNLQKLYNLNFGANNNLGGTIPESLYSLTELTYLTLRQTGISSTISSDIGNLDKLNFLSIYSNNGINGNLPATFNNLTQLKTFEAQSTNLSGLFPDISSLVNLEELNLTDTGFTGNAPNLPTNSAMQFYYSNGANFDNLFSNVEKLPNNCIRFWGSVNPNSPYVPGSLKGKFRISVLLNNAFRLSQLEVDQMISDILWTAQNTSITSQLSLNIDGATSPSAQGLVDKDTLENTYGVTVFI